LVLALRESDHQRAFRLEWSGWRRAHQAVATRCHAVRRKQRNERVCPVESPARPAILARAPVGRTLSDAEWECLRPLLPPQKPSVGRPRQDHRMVLSGILAVVGTGASWREMPAEYGKWETAYKRYRLWCAEGRWQLLLEALDPDTGASPHSADSGP
jgi:hypothetical protein